MRSGEYYREAYMGTTGADFQIRVQRAGPGRATLEQAFNLRAQI